MPDLSTGEHLVLSCCIWLVLFAALAVGTLAAATLLAL
jgi:hypothetical protein